MTSASSMSMNVNDNLPGPGADMVGGGGSCGSHVVPPPPPVPPSPLMPSAAQGVGSPSGGRAHRGGDLPWSPATSVANTSICSEKNLPLPESLLPLPGCNNPQFCVGGLPHVTFSAPGGAKPTREEIEWVTRRSAFLLYHTAPKLTII